MFILPPDLCSGRSDRLAHLPFSSCHPEEDRAGEDILTALPSGLHGATQTKTMTEPEGQREEGQKGGGEVWKREHSSPSLCLLLGRGREMQRETEVLNRPGFKFLCLSFCSWKSLERNLRVFEFSSPHRTETESEIDFSVIDYKHSSRCTPSLRGGKGPAHRSTVRSLHRMIVRESWLTPVSRGIRKTGHLSLIHFM